MDAKELIADIVQQTLDQIEPAHCDANTVDRIEAVVSASVTSLAERLAGCEAKNKQLRLEAQTLRDTLMAMTEIYGPDQVEQAFRDGVKMYADDSLYIVSDETLDEMWEKYRQRRSLQP